MLTVSYWRIRGKAIVAHNKQAQKAKTFHRHNNALNLFYSKFSKGSSKENKCTVLASANALTSERHASDAI